MIGALRFPAYGITQKLAEFRHLTRYRSSSEPHAVIDLDQIRMRTREAKVLLAAVLGVSRYAVSFSWLRCREYGDHRRRGVADRLGQHLNARKSASPFPSCNRSDGQGGGTTT